MLDRRNGQAQLTTIDQQEITIMTTNILTPKKTSKETVVEHPYKLSEADRQAIIQQSPLSKRFKKIESQRLAFINKNGCAEGLEQTVRSSSGV